LALKKFELNPMFIEVERLSSFPKLGTDVSVVLDLMIHDIDLILKIVKGNVRRILANGVSVITDSLDIANARIEFDNGCVANLTASRVSAQKERKMRIFQKNAYITVDFLEKKTEIHQLEESELNGFAIPLEKGRGVRIHTPEIVDNNAIEMELRDFAHSITSNIDPSVTVYDGAKALELAYAILRKIQKSIPI
jgi:predicted dehydrogenase